MTELASNIPEGAITLPIQPVGEFATTMHASCGDCPAICCSAGVIMELSQAEAGFLEQSGTVLRVLTDEVKRRRGFRREAVRHYRLETGCGNLERTVEDGPGICTVFEQKERPYICGKFVVGRMGCMTMRHQKGIIDSDRYDTFLQSC